MAKIEQDIVVNIKTVINGLNQVTAFSNQIKALGRGRVTGLTNDFLRAGAAAGVVNQAVGRTVDLVEQAGRAGAGAFSSFVEEGIRFNAVIESARIGIATLVANTYDVKDASGQLLDPLQAFNASLEKSEELERALQKSAIETKFEFADILTFFNSSVIASAGLKTNLDQLLGLTQDFALAAGAANIEVEKVNTGIQQILTGNTTVRNQLARVIFPGQGTKEINEQLKKYKEAGTLVEFLEGKLKVFRLSADQVGQSFEAVASNATDALKVFEAASTLPLFDKLKATLGFIINQIVDLSGDTVKLTPTFQTIANLLGTIFDIIGGQLLDLVKQIFAYITQWAEGLDQNRDLIFQIIVAVEEIAIQVGGIAADLLGIVFDLGGAAKQSFTWRDVLQYIALLIATMRDIINIIVGTIQTLVGLLVNGAETLFEWLPGLNAIAARFQTIADIVGYIKGASANFANAGVDRFNSGVDFQNFNNTLNRLNQQTPAAPDFLKKRGNFTFSPRTNLGGTSGAGGAGGAKQLEKERIRSAQRLFDELEKHQIANANRQLELATEVNKQLLDSEERRYDKGLVSAEEFYRRKAELENTDLDNQVVNLDKQQKAVKEGFKRKLGAIAGRFSLSQDEVSQVVAKVKEVAITPGATENADATTIKQAQEYVKYLDDIAEITSKRNLIDEKREGIKAGLTEATEKQARANKTLLDGLTAELASSNGNEGLTDLFNLQKRVSDEFPKILTETNKTLPGIKEFAASIQEAALVDPSSITRLLSEAGIEFGSLSDEARTFIRLMERLQALAKVKSISSLVSQAQDTLKFSTEGTQSDFENNRIGLSSALVQTTEAKRVAIEKLTKAYNEQKAVLDLLPKSLVSPKDLQDLEALRRMIGELNLQLDQLALISQQGDRDNTRLTAAREAVDLRREAGSISSKQAKQETLNLQLRQIAALQAELDALLKLDQTSTQVQEKVAETRNRISELRNETNADLINFSQGLNGEIGGAFSDFLNTIQTGTESIGEAFRGLLAGLLLGIAKAIAQALLLKFILQPLGLTGGDSGGLGGLFGGLIFGKPAGKAEGGVISGAGTGTSDSAGVFALSHGEAVLPARRVQQYGLGMIHSLINGSFIPRMSVLGLASGGVIGGSGNGQGHTRIVNVLDPNLVKDFMSSAEGEEIITNVIGRNPQLVQRLV